MNMCGKKSGIPAVFTAVFALILCTATLSGCFSDWTGDEATITINLGADPNTRLAYPPEEDDGIPPKLEHRIKLQGPTGTINLSRTGAGSVTASVAPGNWEITVEDWYEGKQLYATGSGRVTVIGGKNTPVTIEMRRYIVAYSVIQDGGASGTDTSTGIVFTFSTNIDSFGLSADDIDVSGVAEKGAATLSGSGTTWTLSPITVTEAGLANVLIERDGIEAGTKTVIVHKQGQTTPECWNITWNLDGGAESAGAQHPTLIEKDAVLDRPDPDPVKTGYIFDGWYRDAARTQEYIFGSPVTEDLTLHAGWIAANYDINLSLSHKGVSFDPNELFIFPVDAVGYAAQTPLEVTVKNTGDQATGALTATLTGEEWNNFKLSPTESDGTSITISSIPVDDDDGAIFTVAPIGGLGAGTYTATVIVSSSTNSISASFEVSFTVFDPGSTAHLEFELITSGLNDNTYRVTGYKATLPPAVVIPDYYRETGSDDPYLSVTEIGDLEDEYHDLSMFRSGPFTSVIIGKNVTSIGYAAFEMCRALTSIDIPSNVRTIGQRAFAQCSYMNDDAPGLKSITISEGVTSIDYQAFYECELESITIPGSVTSIGVQAFADCKKLIEVIFVAGTESTLEKTGIGENAFPCGFTGYPGPDGNNNLREAYNGPGTYTRTVGGSEWAKQIGVNINGMTVAQIGDAIAAQFADGKNVRVTGTKTDANEVLLLAIPDGRTVTWAANYSSTSNISLSDEGDFVVAPTGSLTSSMNSGVINRADSTGRIIVRGTVSNTGMGPGISSNSDAIIVDGGTINSIDNNAINAYGYDGVTVIIKSGTITSANIGAICLLGTAKLAILGGNIISETPSAYGIISVYDNTTVYVAGNFIADGGIWKNGGTAKGYYATGMDEKFLKSGNYSFSTGDLEEYTGSFPPTSSSWWD